MMTMDVDYDHIYVHLINMDTSIDEAVRPTDDGGYSIFINARLSNEGQVYAFEHAIDHIKNNDFEKESVQEIEAMAHGLIPRTDNPRNCSGNKAVERLLERLRAENTKNKRKLKRLEKKYRERDKFLARAGIDPYQYSFDKAERERMNLDYQ